MPDTSQRSPVGQLRQLVGSNKQLDEQDAQLGYLLLQKIEDVINAAVPALECGIGQCETEGHNHEYAVDLVLELRRLLAPDRDIKARSDYDAYASRHQLYREQSEIALREGRGDRAFHEKRLADPLLEYDDWYALHVYPGTPWPHGAVATADPLTRLRNVLLPRLRDAHLTTLAQQLHLQTTLGTDPQFLVDLAEAALKKD